MIDPEEVKAIERAEQNLAYSRMTRRDDGYITMRPSDLEIFLRLARLATSPEMTAMRVAGRNYLRQTENYSPEHDFSDEELDVCVAALALGKTENADG